MRGKAGRFAARDDRGVRRTYDAGARTAASSMLELCYQPSSQQTPEMNGCIDPCNRGGLNIWPSGASHPSLIPRAARPPNAQEPHSPPQPRGRAPSRHCANVERQGRRNLCEKSGDFRTRKALAAVMCLHSIPVCTHLAKSALHQIPECRHAAARLAGACYQSVGVRCCTKGTGSGPSRPTAGKPSALRTRWRCR